MMTLFEMERANVNNQQRLSFQRKTYYKFITDFGFNFIFLMSRRAEVNRQEAIKGGQVRMRVSEDADELTKEIETFVNLL